MYIYIYFLFVYTYIFIDLEVLFYFSFVYYNDHNILISTAFICNPVQSPPSPFLFASARLGELREVDQ